MSELISNLRIKAIRQRLSDFAIEEFLFEPFFLIWGRAIAFSRKVKIWEPLYFDSYIVQKCSLCNIYTGTPQIVRFLCPQGTVLFGDWYRTKIVIYDFWIFKVPFFSSFSSYFDFWNQKSDYLVSFWNIYWVIYHKFWHLYKISDNF